MKKNELVEVLAAKHEMNKKEMDAIIESLWETIIATIKKGDEVVTSYGKFVLKKRPAREGRNPLTGATVKIAAKVAPQWKPNKKAKDEVAS